MGLHLNKMNTCRICKQIIPVRSTARNLNLLAHLREEHPEVADEIEHREELIRSVEKMILELKGEVYRSYGFRME